jgi:thiamine biosynthesis lipoprotein
MGTTCSVQYVAPEGDGQAQAFEHAAMGWVTAFEAKYSRYRPDSLVSTINAGAGRNWVEVDDDMERLLSLCDTLFGMTRGILDPTALPLLKLWDYKATQPRIPSDAEIAAARSLVGWRKVQRATGRIFLPEPGMALDFGGFGKEYAVDMVAQLAIDRGIPSALVDFGRDLKAVGAPPGRIAWHVGLENPRRPGTHDGSVGVTNRGVASSGDYVRCFHLGGRRYGHIVDPRTGWPVANGCLQCTIIAPSCLQAGVLSTTAFVLGLRDGIDLVHACPGAEGLVVTEHARAQTRGFFNYVAT